MTAPTPEQMRALATRITSRHGVAVVDMDDAAVALRTAAGQLGAVQAWVDEHYHHFPEISDLDAILTADTAPHA